MKGQRDIASFVLRFTQEMWQDDQGDPRVEWRGHIRHVQGDEEFHFTELNEALQFIQKALMQLTMDTVPKDNKPFQEKAMRESFKLWETFAQSYADMMVQAMERTVKQSEAVSRQLTETVEQAWRPWWLMGLAPSGKAEAQQGLSPEDQQRLMQTLLTMQEQLEILARKVNNLEEKMKIAPETGHEQVDSKGAKS
ncbi:MAG: hypothetical protein H3C34_02820 [Caldilineaceae bacterium]|nr:hypothetical protein [Caldilineaceae bacterium]